MSAVTGKDPASAASAATAAGEAVMTTASTSDARVSGSQEGLAAWYHALDGLLAYGRARLGLDPADTDWARNQVLALFGLSSYPTGEDGFIGGLPGPQDAGSETTGPDVRTSPAGMPAEVPAVPDVPAGPGVVLRALDDAAHAAGLYDAADDERFDDIYMGLLAPRPSVLQKRFERVWREDGPMAAMEDFYRSCCAFDYVKKERLDRNIRFTSHGLVITINLAKPEFATQAKAAAGNAVSGGYPSCTICHENEGFAGRDKRTLRTIPLTLGGQPWFWQFSPYGYFEQHGICVNRRHTPMHVSRETFVHLLDFVDQFPGYFLGCNAALPRIGGSVLAHDHYQGGLERLPMHTADAWATLMPDRRTDRSGDSGDRTGEAMSGAAGTLPNGVADGSPRTIVEILDWPGTAVRVVSRSRQDIIDVSERIRAAWADYSDPALGIACRDASGARQSSLSPACVITDRGYEMNLIFRNNAVSEEYPEGVFHAHPQYFAVKHEPIGLIEAQGLFILPARLIRQLRELEGALLSGAPLPDDLAAFRPQWDELVPSVEKLRQGGGATEEAVRQAMRDELGSVCHRILENTAVFKNKADTLGFLERIGFSRV